MHVEPSGYKKNYTPEQAGSTPGTQGRRSAPKPADKKRLPRQLAKEGQVCDRTDSEERYLMKTQHLLRISTLNKLVMRRLDPLGNEHLQTLPHVVCKAALSPRVGPDRSAPSHACLAQVAQVGRKGKRNELHCSCRR